MSAAPFRVLGLVPLAFPRVEVPGCSARTAYAQTMLQGSARWLVLPPTPLLFCALHIGTRCFAMATSREGVSLWRGLEWRVPQWLDVVPSVGAAIELENLSASPVSFAGAVLWLRLPKGVL